MIELRKRIFMNIFLGVHRRESLVANLKKIIIKRRKTPELAQSKRNFITYTLK